MKQKFSQAKKGILKSLQSALLSGALCVNFIDLLNTNLCFVHVWLLIFVRISANHNQDEYAKNDMLGLT